jgi:hypothetical protein
MFMEFEKAVPPPTSITDEQRQRAALKQTTLTPMNPFLKLDDAPDPVVLTETHPNVTRDSENTDRETGALIRPSNGIRTSLAMSQVKPKRHSVTLALIIICLITGVAGGAAFFILIG